MGSLVPHPALAPLDEAAWNLGDRPSYMGETPMPVRAGARGIREVRVLLGPTKPGPKLNITASPRGGVESNGK